MVYCVVAVTRVGVAGRADWGAAFDVFIDFDFVFFGNCFTSFFVMLEGPLFFGAIDLAKIIDACVLAGVTSRFDVIRNNHRGADE